MGRLNPKLSEKCFRETKTDRICSFKGNYPDFELKDYCPAVFRNILDLQNIAYTDYLRLICGDEHLLHFVASAKFGNVFVSPVNDRFVIKILRKSELKVMLEMLPSYYNHLLTYRTTLLSKLYGLHVIRLSGGVKAHIAVMSNVLKSNLQPHRCYDLKGTDIGRNTNTIIAENRTVLKDVDFDFYFYLDPVVHRHLLKQIKYDCKFLEDEGIMDYSFMLSIHFEEHHEGLLNHKSSSRGSTCSSRSSASGRSSLRSSSHSTMDNSDYSSEGSYGKGLSLPHHCSTSGSSCVKLGVDMPGSVMLSKTKCVNVVLNFGIVDIFQRYNVPKRLERLYKSIQYDSHSITAVNPKVYSSRFRGFLGRVFQSEDSVITHPECDCQNVPGDE